MGSQDEQFCLKWNDFQQCIKSTFQDLREESDFMDVTLSCEGEQLKAHKVILSACSLTFKNLLKKTPSQNPVILLWDVSPRDLSAILDFMYNGEVNVKQEHLNSFLAVAEKLRVRGLCQDGKSSSSSSSKDNQSKPRSRVASSNDTPTPKRPKFSSSEENDIQEIPVTPAVKQEKTETAATAVYPAAAAVVAQDMMVVNPEDYGGEGEDYGEYYDDDGGYAGGVDPVDPTQSGKDEAVVLENGELGFRCEVCFKDFPANRKSNWRRHTSTVHNGDEQVPCSVCAKRFKNRITLNSHIANAHREPFQGNRRESFGSPLGVLKEDATFQHENDNSMSKGLTQNRHMRVTKIWK